MIRTWLADIRALYDEECYQKYFAAHSCVSTRESKEAVVSERQGSECRGMAFIGGDQKAVRKFPTGQFTIFRIPGIMCCARSTLMQERAYSLDVILRKSKRPEWS